MSVLQILEVPAHVVVSLTIAANVTGVDRDYLALTAARESSFQIAAQARTSSAQGMFQFIEQTWLRMVAENGKRHGLARLRKHIRIDRNGKHYVRSRAIRQRILNLRKDPTMAAIMAGYLTKRNAGYFHKRYGRKAGHGDLYVAHFLGARNAVKLAQLARRYPDARANRYFRAAAKSNMRIFYKGRQPRTVRQVYHQLVSKHRGVRVTFSSHGNSRVRGNSNIEAVLPTMRVSSHRPQRLKMENSSRPGLQYMAALMRLPDHGK